uniref:Flightin n=1 Tax=Sogatella furcifera TaxID=113103 RepID=M9T1P6_SOGFU|nr:flightin [Sogatella furcifera]
MADPDAPWMLDDTPEDVPAEGEDGAPAEEAPVEVAPPVKKEPSPPPKKKYDTSDPWFDIQRAKKKYICRHWVRPKYLQYKYMEQYRRNYYDEYIEFLDKRNKGMESEPPKPQTWAERALRTYRKTLDRYWQNIMPVDYVFTKPAPNIHYVNMYRADHTREHFYRRHYDAIHHSEMWGARSDVPWNLIINYVPKPYKYIDQQDSYGTYDTAW